MIRWRAVGRWVGSTVAGGALIRYWGLAVIPLRGFPGGRAMAANTVGRGWDVCHGFASGVTAVVTARAISRAGEAAVVHAGSRGPCRCLVARAARCLSHHVPGRLSGCGGSVVAAGTGAGRNADVVKVCSRKRHGGVAGLAPQCGLKVLTRLDYIGF